MTKILLAAPSYDGQVNWNSARMAMGANAGAGIPTLVMQMSSSFLTLNFNSFWCTALNDPSITHFAMLHADIVPQSRNWLEQMLKIQKDYGADVLSVVSPLKNELGLTSIAARKAEAEYKTPRRLSMTEIFRLPETFNRKHVAELWDWDKRETTLLVNTGMLLVDIRKRDKAEQICFTVNNWIRKNAEGKFYAESEPEDWHFSQQAANVGWQVWATRAIPLEHLGGKAYSNQQVWGELADDVGNKNQ